MSKVSTKEKVSENTDKPTNALYRVKAKGFSEQYTSYTVAKRNFDSLKRKAIKNEQSFTIYLDVKENGKWSELEKASISESFYNND